MVQKAVLYLGTASEHTSKRRKERGPDEEEIFFKYIVNELHQISDGHFRHLAKDKIENILFEAHCSIMDASFPQKGQLFVLNSHYTPLSVKHSNRHTNILTKAEL